MSETETKVVTHTPGPWKVDPDFLMLVPDEVAIMDESGNVICGVWPYGEFDDTDDQDANARLIASAPQLLEALKLARPYIPTHANQYMTLRAKELAKETAAKVDAAIAKAEGAA